MVSVHNIIYFIISTTPMSNHNWMYIISYIEYAVYVYIYKLYTMQWDLIIDAIAMGTDGFSVANEYQIMKGSARELKW